MEITPGFPDFIHPDLKAARRQYSTVGLAYTCLLVVVIGLQLLTPYVLGASLLDFVLSDWFPWAMSAIIVYLLGIPVGLLVLRRTRGLIAPERPLGSAAFLTCLVICLFIQVAGSLLGNACQWLVDTLTGVSSLGSIQTLVAGVNSPIKLLTLVVLAPLLEEYFFRKQLLDRLRGYGEKLAICISALLFGLYHQNLTQFFYAFGLGLLFGYVYIRTGRLRYTIAMHMLINFFGGVFSAWMLQGIDIDAFVAAASGATTMQAAISPQLILLTVWELVLFGGAITGLVLLIERRKKLRFLSMPDEIPVGCRAQIVFGNIGMIAAMLLSLVGFGWGLFG